MKLEDALKWMDDNENDIEEINEVCPISKQPIQNKITLSCCHSFEYFNLFKELIQNGNNTRYHKCPYCRKTNEGFIPYYDIEPMKNYYKVKNRLNNFNNNYLQCQHVFKTGKNKGLKCNKCAHKFNHGNYCFSHKKLKETKCKVEKEPKIQCTKILKNGNRCKKSCTKDNVLFCYIHAKNN